MTLPVLLTEDQIFSPSFNPPSSREEVGACAEGVDCYLFVDDWVEPDEEPDDRPDDEAELETTPSLIAMQVHLDAIGDLVSLQPGPMPEVTETPDDPLCVPHSVATWQNEGINQTEQQQHDMHHHREGGPAGSVTRGQGSQRRRRKLAKPVTTPLEDLRVPRSQVLEFAKLKSNLLFPVILPKCAGRDVWPTDMSCSMYPEPQIMYPVCQAPIEYPQPMQQFSPPSPAPNWQARIHEYPQPIPPSPVPAPIWQAPIEYPQPIQQFSPESPVPVPAPMQCYETNILFPAMSPMYAGMYYVEPYVPLTATAMDFVPFTTLPRPQPTFAPTTNAPAEFSTNVTTARIVNMMNTDVETLTGGVDMLSRIEIFHVSSQPQFIFLVCVSSNVGQKVLHFGPSSTFRKLEPVLDFLLLQEKSLFLQFLFKNYIFCCSDLYMICCFDLSVISSASRFSSLKILQTAKHLRCTSCHQEYADKRCLFSSHEWLTPYFLNWHYFFSYPISIHF